MFIDFERPVAVINFAAAAPAPAVCPLRVDLVRLAGSQHEVDFTGCAARPAIDIDVDVRCAVGAVRPLRQLCACVGAGGGKNQKQQGGNVTCPVSDIVFCSAHVHLQFRYRVGQVIAWLLAHNETARSAYVFFSDFVIGQ